MERHCWRSGQQIRDTNTLNLTHTNTYSILISPSCFLQLGQKLFTATETILSPGPLDSSEDVSGLLGTVENSIMLIGPQLKDNRTKLETRETGNNVHKLSCDLHIVLKKISAYKPFPWMMIHRDFNKLKWKM